MPNITTQLGQYCIVHGYEHKEEYLVCDFCNEHKDWICCYGSFIIFKLMIGNGM
jgi:hypothetical protein